MRLTEVKFALDTFGESEEPSYQLSIYYDNSAREWEIAVRDWDENILGKIENKKLPTIDVTF